MGAGTAGRSLVGSAQAEDEAYKRACADNPNLAHASSQPMIVEFWILVLIGDRTIEQ